MNKSNLKELLNATSYGMQELNKEIKAVVAECGSEGLTFAEGKRPYGMLEDRQEFPMTAIRYNEKEDYLEAKDDTDGDWFPVFTSLIYENYIDPIELAEYILLQD